MKRFKGGLEVIKRSEKGIHKNPKVEKTKVLLYDVK